MQSKTDIGFGKKIRAVWLDSALDHAVSGQPFDTAKESLAGEIAANNAGPEAIRKIQTSLKRVWLSPPDYCLHLRNDALRLLPRNAPAATRLLFHWGMSIAAYPFIGSVAETLGRLLKLQNEVLLAEVARRVRERHGDRDFVGRITRYDVSSFLDWGVIAGAGRPGAYRAGSRLDFGAPEQLGWLVEAAFISVDKQQMPLSELQSHPILFPFKMETLHSSVLRANPRLTVVRQNLRDEFVILGAPSPPVSVRIL